ncbi:hypothetical protein JCGZ_10899 [Jatropha curcas]|uniref:Uncharacterized protein n=1 Tax=Jatropha curcas TaxID=180498 RepID=A0A067KSB2_JATCU|nr:hypothetical protein JCGZ_10899 [Jatropha curcas]
MAHPLTCAPGSRSPIRPTGLILTDQSSHCISILSFLFHTNRRQPGRLLIKRSQQEATLRAAIKSRLSGAQRREANPWLMVNDDGEGESGATLSTGMKLESIDRRRVELKRRRDFPISNSQVSCECTLETKGEREEGRRGLLQ